MEHPYPQSGKAANLAFLLALKADEKGDSMRCDELLDKAVEHERKHFESEAVAA